MNGLQRSSNISQTYYLLKRLKNIKIGSNIYSTRLNHANPDIDAGFALNISIAVRYPDPPKMLWHLKMEHWMRIGKKTESA